MPAVSRLEGVISLVSLACRWLAHYADPLRHGALGGRRDHVVFGGDQVPAWLAAPRTVHNEGKGGFVGLLTDQARRTRVSGYPGDGTQRWPAVHALDAAVLFRLAWSRHRPGRPGTPSPMRATRCETSQQSSAAAWACQPRRYRRRTSAHSARSSRWTSRRPVPVPATPSAGTRRTPACSRTWKTSSPELGGHADTGQHAHRAVEALADRGTRLLLLSAPLLADLVTALLAVHPAGTGSNTSARPSRRTDLRPPESGMPLTCRRRTKSPRSSAALSAGTVPNPAPSSPWRSAVRPPKCSRQAQPRRFAAGCLGHGRAQACLQATLL